MSDLIERPTDAADPTYPDAERCAQTLEACEDDLLTEAQFVRWQGQEIERLTAERNALRADLLAGRNVVNAGLTIHTLTLERDDLRRQLAEAEQDARRYRWLRGEHKRVDPICAVIWKRNGDRNGSEWVNTANIDAEIDAAMGASNE